MGRYTKSQFPCQHIDPFNGNISRLDTLYGVEDAWTAQSTSTLNKTSEIYTFATYLNNTFTVADLYNVNINTGAIISNPTLSVPVTELNFDILSGNYYGLEFEDTTATPTVGLTHINDNGDTTITGTGAVATSGIYHTVSVNTTTGLVSRISNLLGVTSISTNNSAYNSSNNYFTFVDNNDLIYTINLANGSIISNPSLSTTIHELQYNSVTGVYYALENSGNDYFLVTVDPSTGISNRVGSINGLNSIQTCTSTLDEINDIYSITDNNEKLFNINLSTASLNSNPQLSCNVIGLTINSSVLPTVTLPYTNNITKNIKNPSGDLPVIKDLQGNPNSIFNEKNLAYPNPAKNQLTIEVSAVPTTLNIYTITGDFIKTEILQQKVTTINIEEFKTGLYYFNLDNINKIETKKIFVK